MLLTTLQRTGRPPSVHRPRLRAPDLVVQLYFLTVSMWIFNLKVPLPLLSSF